MQIFPKRTTGRSDPEGHYVTFSQSLTNIFPTYSMCTVSSKFRSHCFFQMDKGAIWEASEEDLHQLGLTERGDIIRFKAFCTKTSDNKQKLAEFISNAGKERTSHKKSRKEKVVSLGWVHFNERKNKYCAVRMSKGGGTRQHHFPNNASAEEILNFMKLTFFPNGSSSLGKLCDMQIRLGNFQQQVLDVERFNSSDYKSKNKFTKTRLYLLSKEKSRSQKIRDLCTENLLKDDDGNDSFELDFVSSAGLNNATCLSSKKLNTEVPNGNRFNDMNTGIQVAQCSSAT